MSRKIKGNANDRQVNEMFERQNRRLNQKRFINAVTGIALLAAILIALQFTPYRDVPRNVIKAAASFIKDFTSESSAPKESDAKYW
ncbi:hypothetical protein HZA56_04410 [Candidatus Poribacteria bacterium]|nr:hypothetical protein [Candidatus Poribacteria bacterium]